MTKDEVIKAMKDLDDPNTSPDLGLSRNDWNDFYLISSKIHIDEFIENCIKNDNPQRLKDLREVYQDWTDGLSKKYYLEKNTPEEKIAKEIMAYLDYRVCESHLL